MSGGAATPTAPASARRAYPRSFLLGATFSIAWTPCVGPILGVVLTLAATTGSWQQGALLLTSYSLGLGVWFIAFGAFFGWLAPRMRAIRPHLPRLMVASGVIFIVAGALMFLGEFERLNQYFQRVGFLFDGTVELEQGLADAVGGWFGPAVAFFGGVVSFLSPCVLPLVPVYLVNVGGEAALHTQDPAARRRVIGSALAFVVGFTVVFALVGASAGFAGGLVVDHLGLLTRIGGVVLMVLGMQMSGLIRIPYLDRTYQLPG